MRSRIRRPFGGVPTFVCTQCAQLVATEDGCRACGRPVDWVSDKARIQVCSPCDRIMFGDTPVTACTCGGALRHVYRPIDRSEGLFAKSRWLLPLAYVVFALIEPRHLTWV